MSTVFVDTSYHVATLDRSDDMHRAAMAAANRLTPARASFVTSDVVIIELLTYFASWGEAGRRAAAEYVSRLRIDSQIIIVPNTPALFDASLDLYLRRSDKAYSMVDCMSMVICRERGITEVLTADHDFEQEGFAILLT